MIVLGQLREEPAQLRGTAAGCVPGGVEVPCAPRGTGATRAALRLASGLSTRESGTARHERPYHPRGNDLPVGSPMSSSIHARGRIHMQRLVTCIAAHRARELRWQLAVALLVAMLLGTHAAHLPLALGDHDHAAAASELGVGHAPALHGDGDRAGRLEGPLPRSGGTVVPCLDEVAALLARMVPALVAVLVPGAAAVSRAGLATGGPASRQPVHALTGHQRRAFLQVYLV